VNCLFLLALFSGYYLQNPFSFCTILEPEAATLLPFVTQLVPFLHIILVFCVLTDYCTAIVCEYILECKNFCCAVNHDELPADCS